MPGPQLIVDRAVLEALHKRAASAAYRASYIADAEVLGDEMDVIVHVLSELLGNPRLRVGPVPDACPRFDADEVTRTELVTWDGALAFVEPEAPTPWLPLPAAAESLDDLAPALDPRGFVAASTIDEPTRPRVRRLRSKEGRSCHRAGRAATWPVRGSRSPAVAESHLASRWVRGATITALIALLGGDRGPERLHCRWRCAMSRGPKRSPGQQKRSMRRHDTPAAHDSSAARDAPGARDTAEICDTPEAHDSTCTVTGGAR